MPQSAPFEFTEAMVVQSNTLWMVVAAVGAGLCFLVLLVIGLLFLIPVSRPSLDRVSFRIVTAALGANTIFGITNAVGGSFKGPTPACGFDIFLLQFTLQLSSFLILCIALNLQFVVVHRMNGKRLEKFYLIGSLAISLCLTIPPYAASQYGWDSLVNDCWYSSPNKEQRLAWQIGTQLFWTLLTVVGELCASATVMIFMLRHQRRMQGALRSTELINSRGSQADIVTHYAHKYRNVIVRVALYPLASCIINLTSVMCVIYATAHHGVHSMTGYRILLMSDVLYGGRAIVYAFLAASDPAFLAGLGALKRHLFSTNAYGKESTMRTTNDVRSRSHQEMQVHIELTRTHHVDAAHLPAELKDNANYSDLCVKTPQKVDRPQTVLIGNGPETLVQRTAERRDRMAVELESAQEAFKKQI